MDQYTVHSCYYLYPVYAINFLFIIPLELLPIPLNSLIHLLSKWHSLFCFFAAGATLAILLSLQQLAAGAHESSTWVPRLQWSKLEQKLLSEVFLC